MVGRVLITCAIVALVWACGGGKGEQPAKEQAAPTATMQAGTPQEADDYDDYEELDVWIEAEPDEGPPPLRVHFTSEVESDIENGGPYRYDWNFGDGSKSAEANPIHTYQKLGEYTVTCNVTDDKGNNGSDEIDVWVEEE